MMLEWLQPCFYKAKHNRTIDAQAKPGYFLGPATNHRRDCARVYAKKSEHVLFTRNVTGQYVPPPLPSSDGQTIPAPAVGGETGDTTGEGRKGTSRPGGGGEDASTDDDDDLDVTWVGSSGAADDIDAAAGETPKTQESYAGSFGGGESGAPSPRSSNSHSTSGSSNFGSSSSTSSSNSSGCSSNGSDDSDNGSRGGGVAGECAVELPKGEAHSLQSWSNPVIFLSRTRGGNQSSGEEPASSLRTPSWLTR